VKRVKRSTRADISPEKSLAPYRELSRKKAYRAVNSCESETVSIGATWRKPLVRWPRLWSYKRFWAAQMHKTMLQRTCNRLWLQPVMGRFLSHKPGRSGNFASHRLLKQYPDTPLLPR
jgi:hypothetical protein